MELVRTGRLELPRVAPLEPKSSASANSATFAGADKPDSIEARSGLLPPQDSGPSYIPIVTDGHGVQGCEKGSYRDAAPGFRDGRLDHRRAVPHDGGSALGPSKRTSSKLNTPDRLFQRVALMATPRWGPANAQWQAVRSVRRRDSRTLSSTRLARVPIFGAP